MLLYQVFQVNDNSPSDNAGIKSSDVIMKINFQRIKTLESFTQFIAAHENKDIVLTVFNEITKTFRNLLITPRKWKGEGLLGLAVSANFCDDIHIFVKTLNGTEILFTVNRYLKVEQFKANVCISTGFEKCQLLFQGRALLDDRVLNDYSIDNGSRVYMVGELSGGGSNKLGDHWQFFEKFTDAKNQKSGKCLHCGLTWVSHAERMRKHVMVILRYFKL